MKQQLLKANNGGSGTVKVEVNPDRTIHVNKKGFVSVSDHSMYMTTIRYEYIEKYYKVPKDMQP